MLEKIREVIAEQLDVNPDEITEDTNLQDDLGADSLDIVELVMAFESEYDIELPTEERENIATVKDIMDLMKKMGVDA
jgi:acyl carrier protein